jgi:hypothetical protein
MNFSHNDSQLSKRTCSKIVSFLAFKIENGASGFDLAGLHSMFPSFAFLDFVLDLVVDSRVLDLLVCTRIFFHSGRARAEYSSSRSTKMIELEFQLDQ